MPDPGTAEGLARPAARRHRRRRSSIPVTGEEKPRARYDEHGKLLNAGEAIGEIVSRNAASRFEGYYNNPEADAERTRNGWYWSGDLGYRDEDGVFWFAGRNADWIRVDGENFAAAPIERILARFPGVDGVAVYAVPDSRTGDQVMVAIEMLPGVDVRSGRVRRPSSPSSATSARSGRRATCASSTRCRSARPNKIDKRPLRAERWETTDPVFWRRPRERRVRAASPPPTPTRCAPSSTPTVATTSLTGSMPNDRRARSNATSTPCTTACTRWVRAQHPHATDVRLGPLRKPSTGLLERDPAVRPHVDGGRRRQGGRARRPPPTGRRRHLPGVRPHAPGRGAARARNDGDPRGRTARGRARRARGSARRSS